MTLILFDVPIAFLPTTGPLYMASKHPSTDASGVGAGVGIKVGVGDGAVVEAGVETGVGTGVGAGVAGAGVGSAVAMSTPQAILAVVECTTTVCDTLSRGSNPNWTALTTRSIDATPFASDV